MFAELVKRKTQTKNKINNLIVSHLTSANKKGYHLVLDSVTLGTSNIYCNNGVLPANIYIPQIDCQEFLGMAENKLPVKLYRCPASNLIDHFIPKSQKFQSVYLDYCCSAYGNKNINPEQDLKNSLKILEDGGILAWTFSTRSLIPQDYTYQGIDDIRRKLDSYAKDLNITLRHLFSFPYKSGANKKIGRPKKKNKGNTGGQTMIVTGVRIEQNFHSYGRFSKQQVLNILEDREKGLSFRQLCNKYKASKGTLYYFFNESKYVQEIIKSHS